MRSKVTVVLLFLNVLLFYYIFHYEQQWQAERAQLEARKRVLGPEAATIEKFSHRSPSAPSLAAEKREDGWWLTQPLEWPANPNAIARVISDLQFLEHITSFSVADVEKGNRSLADYGLAEPAMTFTFTSGDKSYALELGDRTEIGNRLYLLAPDRERIHVVAQTVADSLGLGFEQLRSRSVFTVPVFEVRSLAVQTALPANLKIRLRREGPRWLLEAPILARANKPAVEGAITALNSLSALRFIEPRDPDAGRTGLAAPQLRLTLEGNSRRETLLLGAPVHPTPADAPTSASTPIEFFAKFEEKPAVFVTALSPKLLDDLRRAQEQFRDPQVLDFDPASVTALTLSAPNQPEVNLQRLESTQAIESWQLIVRPGGGQSPQTLTADTAVVRELVTRLQELQVQQFVSDAPTSTDLENFGFNRPEIEVSLALSSGGGPRGTEPTSLTLQIGARPGQRSTVYARLAGSPFIYQIDPSVLEDITVTARHYRQRLLRELPEGTRITGLALTDLSTNTPLVQKAASTDGALAADSIAAGEPDGRRPALQTLLAYARTLRARDYTAAPFAPNSLELDGTTTPWRYRLDIDLTLTGGTAQTTRAQLYFTERLGGTTQYGGTAEFGGVTFNLPQDLIDALFTLTYAAAHDPGPPTAPPATPPPPLTSDQPKP